MGHSPHSGTFWLCLGLGKTITIKELHEKWERVYLLGGVKEVALESVSSDKFLRDVVKTEVEVKGLYMISGLKINNDKSWNRRNHT